jgi:hypothetical protein
LTSTGFYQAACNIPWLSPMTATAFYGGVAPSWQAVHDASSSLWGKASAVCDPQRLLLPLVVGVGVFAPEEVDADTFEQSLVTLGAHTVLRGRYFAVARAMLAGDQAYLRMVWEAGLSVTVLVESGLTNPTRWAIRSARFTERLRLHADVACDGSWLSPCWEAAVGPLPSSHGHEREQWRWSLQLSFSSRLHSRGDGQSDALRRPQSRSQRFSSWRHLFSTAPGVDWSRLRHPRCAVYSRRCSPTLASSHHRWRCESLLHHRG